MRRGQRSPRRRSRCCPASPHGCEWIGEQFAACRFRACPFDVMVEGIRIPNPLGHSGRLATTENAMSTSSARTANRLLWTAQILAALLFLFAGAMKFFMPVEQMQQGPIAFPLAFLYFIGV